MGLRMMKSEGTDEGVQEREGACVCTWGWGCDCWGMGDWMCWPTVRGEDCDGWGLSAMEGGTALAAITGWEGEAVWILSGCCGPAVDT